jgi:scyllo-inositol 2-dehydrogenase (NADP+)
MSNAVIRVGLVGMGLAGSVFHAPLIRACKRMELTAVLTSRGAANAVRSMDDLVQASDLIVVASPNATHFPIAKQALESGKHVVVDKPFTVTVSEAVALIRLARSKRRVLSVFHNRRWDDDYLTLMSVLPSIGDVQLFEANWDRFRPRLKQGWREMAGAGSGLFNDLGPHLIDQAMRLFGLPTAVQADIHIQRKEAVVDDYFDVTLHYGRMRACLRSSTLIASPRPRFAVHGTEGSYISQGLDPQEVQLKEGYDPRDPQFGRDGREGLFVHPDGSSEVVPLMRGNYLAYYDELAAAILDGAPVPVTAEDALDGLGIIALARRASTEGRLLHAEAASSMAE